MTKKDYELFANAVYRLKPNHAEEDKPCLRFSELVGLLGDCFSQDNPAFQRTKFMTACYEGKHIRKSISGRV